MKLQKTKAIRGAIVIGILGLSGVVGASSAWACGAIGCLGKPAFLLPEEGAQIPMNAPAFLWTPFDSRVSTSAGLLLENQNSGELVAVDVMPFESAARTSMNNLSILLDAPLELGATYQLTTPSTESCQNEQVLAPTFTITEAAELPEALGTPCIHNITHRSLKIANDASCSLSKEALWADIGLHLDPSAQPWEDLLVYETFVNGQPWTPTSSAHENVPVGSSWVGRGIERVFAVCTFAPFAGEFISSPVKSLQPGEYTVHIQASLPGTTMVWKTPEFQLKLLCEGTDQVAADVPLCDAPPVDPDTLTGDIQDSNTIAPGEDANAGCSTTPNTPTPTPWWALGLLAVFGVAFRHMRA